MDSRDRGPETSVHQGEKILAEGKMEQIKV